MVSGGPVVTGDSNVDNEAAGRIVGGDEGAVARLAADSLAWPAANIHMERGVYHRGKEEDCRSEQNRHCQDDSLIHFRFCFVTKDLRLLPGAGQEPHPGFTRRSRIVGTGFGQEEE